MMNWFMFAYSLPTLQHLILSPPTPSLPFALTIHFHYDFLFLFRIAIYLVVPSHLISSHCRIVYHCNDCNLKFHRNERKIVFFFGNFQVLGLRLKLVWNEWNITIIYTPISKVVKSIYELILAAVSEIRFEYSTWKIIIFAVFLQRILISCLTTMWQRVKLKLRWNWISWIVDQRNPECKCYGLCL